jgi:hypothetical protein
LKAMENSREADISTQQSCAQAPPWIPFSHENRGWTARSGTSARTRA